MALITIPQLDRRSRAELLDTRPLPRIKLAENVVRKVAAQTLMKEAKAPFGQQFDIFLSHSFRDAVRVIELKRFIQELGYSVYVDWDDDADLDRQSVDATTASMLRMRIKMSRCLLVHVTENASTSRWVPWELGFADGAGKRVGVLPTPTSGVRTDEYAGEEYLQLYPYIDFAEDQANGQPTLWANRDARNYVTFEKWLEGDEPRAVPRRSGTLRALRG